MSYIKPKDVLSPKVSVSNLRPIYDEGEGKWSAALLDWDQEPSVGIRWNGQNQSPGNPQSRGLPTWFVMPNQLGIPVLRTLLTQGLVGGEDIQRDTAQQAVQRFIALHGEEAVQHVDADFEVKVREIIGKLIAERKLVAGHA